MKKFFLVFVLIIFAACSGKKISEPSEENFFAENFFSAEENETDNGEIIFDEEEIIFEEEIPEEENKIEDEIEIIEEENKTHDDEIILEEKTKIAEENFFEIPGLEDPHLFAANAIEKIIDMIKIPQGEAGAFDVSVNFEMGRNYGGDFVYDLLADANIKFVSDGEKIETFATIKTDLGYVAGAFFRGIEFEISIYTSVENGIAASKIFIANEEMRPDTPDTFGIAAMIDSLNYEKFLLEFLAYDFDFPFEILENFWLIPTRLGDTRSVSIYDIGNEFDFVFETLGIKNIEKVEFVTLGMYTNNTPQRIISEISLQKPDADYPADYYAIVRIFFNAAGSDVKIILPSQN